MSPRKRVYQSVSNCVRCGRNHERLLRREFKRPPEVLVDRAIKRWGYWLRCPKTGDPILIRAERA
jgi:hypothetical protein